MSMTTVRQRVLAYLEKQQSATAEEIARSLGMTPANVRYHLGQLQRAGVVQVISRQNPGGRGRPRQVYALDAARRGSNLPALTQTLLEMLAARLDTPEALWPALAAALLEGMNLPAAFTPRLNAAVDWLDAHAYHARWEAHAEGPHVIFEHCPYLDVLDEAPGLCQMDALLLEIMLDRPVTQLARREISRRGLPLCLFLVARS